MNIIIEPLHPSNWSAFEQLFGGNGACGGCWCTLWRQKRSDFEKNKGEKNKIFMRNLVDEGKVPGILAFVDGQPAGWCAFAPREEYPALERSRVMKKIDDTPVWSISCFFIAKPFRRQGIAYRILSALQIYAKRNNCKILEAYPVEPKDNKMPDVFAWTGIAKTFVKAGFKEVVRRTPTRPVFRYYLSDS